MIRPSSQSVFRIPGAPPRQDFEEDDGAEQDNFQFQETASATDDRAPEKSDSLPDTVDHPDSSYGLASLYLATLSFFLFFTPAILAGMTGAIGASIAYFAGIFVSAGCFVLCWHGYRLAQAAEHSPHGQGYVIAGKIVNRFLLIFYVLGVVFFIVGGIVMLVSAKHAMSQFGDQLKGLDQLQGLEKLLGK